MPPQRALLFNELAAAGVRAWALDGCQLLGRRSEMLLILGIILLVIAIAGGAIVHPVIFALGIVALVLFFMHGRGGARV
jgi:hypothetical protein